MKTRNQVLELASFREFDLVVIGAGIVGAGIAQDAACRGLSVIVIDQDDFASGTSSRTTKLVHGGLRYLEKFQFKLTSTLCQERALLEQLAPHLVQDFSFVLPLIKGSFITQIKAALGLTLYDMLAFAQPGAQPHQRIGRKEVLEAAPVLDREDVIGGLKFHDAITDDSRLVLEVLKSASNNGALAINYLQATGFGIEQNKIKTVVCRDRINGQEITLNCKACVNATGVWIDHVTKLIDKHWDERVLPAKGIHIMVPPSAFETNTALFLPAYDGRYIFVIPWQRAIMIGTTDSLYSGELNKPLPNADEVDYLLSAVNKYTGEHRLNRSDVTAAWAGLRPLVDPHKHAFNLNQATDSGNGKHALSSDQITTANISREHAIFTGPGGMIGVLGGKLTNYRLMAGEVLEQVFLKFPELIHPAARTSRTQRMMLGGWLDRQDYLTQTAAIAAKARKLSIEPATIAHLIATYGKDAQRILEVIDHEPQLSERICPDFPPIMAEIPHCVQAEMAVSLEDLLSRRVRLAQLHHQQCLAAAPKVARLMQNILSWDDKRITAELKALQNSLGSMEWEMNVVKR